MSDSTGPQRRQPPSPLFFSSDSVLSPPSSQSSHNASASNTVSMPFVRRHVTRRLKAAKAECDKELQRVTNNITAFFEERLKDGEYDTDRDFRDRDRDSQIGDPDHLRDPYVFQPNDLRSALQVDESSSDGGYEAEVEYHSRHSRQPSSTSSSISPSTVRRQQPVPWERPLSSSMSSSAVSSSPASSTVMLPEVPLTRKPANSSPGPTSWNNQSTSSRRLSRSIHIPSRPSHSGQSSRSTSRSRSPLPPLQSHASFSDYGSAPSSSNNRRASRILIDDPVDPIMTTLYELIGVATDIIDMSINQLTAHPKTCEALVQRVQIIGKAWDEHPDWHGRNWYVQILLAVASLSRVVEWWEAEKQFWNFNDNDEEQEEPLLFVMKAADATDEPVPPPVHTPTDKQDFHDLENFKLNPDDENKLRLHRPASHSRKSRDEQPKSLAVSADARPEPHPRTPSKIHDYHESARVLATERLRLQAETAQNQNIVLELSLDGDHLIWINYAWRVVVGTDPDEFFGTRVSNLLHPVDAQVFNNATQRLLEDDSHTVEARFKLRVVPEDDRDTPQNQTLYQQMEGKGMLMIDREDGEPSHTMWVIKPIASPRYEYDYSHGQHLSPEPLSSEDAAAASPPGAEPSPEQSLETPLPFQTPISIQPILCRICECQIPQWYFEKHSETCVETHRLEYEILECNESIQELRNTIRDLASIMDSGSSSPAPEYRGMSIFSPSSSPVISSPLQLFRANKMQKFGVKKMQRRLLDQLEDILQVAAEVSVPSLKEEEAKEPIERQRLLSPGSERKMSQIRNWGKPNIEDAALKQLIQDVERVTRSKIDNVVRMQNTIRYAEKIWNEWQERVGAYLNDDGSSGSESSSGEDEEVVEEEPSEQPVKDIPAQHTEDADDASSTTSEYAFTGSSDPTPLAAGSPVPSATPPEQPRPSSTTPVSSTLAYSTRHTRSSTPSSISSPLALAAPIVASSSPEDNVPAMSLDEPQPSRLTIKTRKSASNLLEPKFVVTPPASPQVAPKDAPTASGATGLTREPSTKRSHRRHSTVNPIMSPGPLSPRQPSTAPLSRTNPTSIKDFDIIKPISKGAFGSVFLAKKKATGDYYAIKVLKKADMIAKNQITNVKAERMILMKQAESPFVAKLYFTFQSKENLYLVMEYLNGGDCGNLIKSLGTLPEEWAKNYIAEVVLGLEYLHERGIVHRDLKPDNLLIDQHGHLKLTDFGLSRIGLLGRQTREGQAGRPYTRYNSRSRPPSIDAAYLSSPLFYNDPNGSYFTQRTNSVPRFGSSPYLHSTDDVSEFGVGGGEPSSAGVHVQRRRSGKADSPLQSFATELTTDLRSHSHSNSNSNSVSGTPPGDQKFVGTPDYLAPETILGLRGDDAAVDWWALGVITYEFLYGIPPFNDETPEKVFENILSGHIEWHEEWVDFSPEARDFMERLLITDPALRLGANGADEVKAHPWFYGIDWDKVTTEEAAFVPSVQDPESTEYFDARGAVPMLFHDDDQVAVTSDPGAVGSSDAAVPQATTLPLPVPGSSKEGGSVSTPSDDFGSFSFKNLPVLKQANDDVIRKLKTDQMVPLTHAISEQTGLHSRRRSVSHRVKKPEKLVTTMEPSKTIPTNPPSPATSTSSIASSPSRTSLPPSTPGSAGGGHARKPSEFGAVERFKQNQLDGLDRRNTMPSRLRTASVSSGGDGSGSETWNSSVGHGSTNTPPSSVHSIDLRKGPDPSDRAITCLLAEDNPITAKIIETLLIRLGCRCVVVADGSEAISVAMGDIKFDCILMDIHMPVLDGEGAARYIKSTNSKNTNTPIIAVSAYSGVDQSEGSNVFSAYLSKPLNKADLIVVFRQLGFKTTTMQGPGTTKVTALRNTPAAIVSAVS